MTFKIIPLFEPLHHTTAYQAMEKAQRKDVSECRTPSSEPYRTEVIHDVLFIVSLCTAICYWISRHMPAFYALKEKLCIFLQLNFATSPTVNQSIPMSLASY
jgi:hypothetical protein